MLQWVKWAVATFADLDTLRGAATQITKVAKRARQKVA